MVGTNAIFDVEQMKQREMIVDLTAHECSPKIRSGEFSARNNRIQAGFSSAC
jgi:hypothetical protein